MIMQDQQLSLPNLDIPKSHASENDSPH
jgi:hypothetical protein